MLERSIEKTRKTWAATRAKVRFWLRAPRRWLLRFCTRLLTKPLKSYELRVPNNMAELRAHLRKGDVLLIEGDQRVSQVIRYLTQSSWSHSALYIGDELLRRGGERARKLKEAYGEDAAYLIVEAVDGEGVVASPLGKYEHFNLRVCRPKGLRKEDLAKILDWTISRIGCGYNVRHILALARYFFPVSLVPRRWRRAALHFGEGEDREVICSSMIARAFFQVGYPILPRVVLDPAGTRPSWWERTLFRRRRRPLVRFRPQDPALITPRDFDLSPYFEIVKFSPVAGQKFDYRDIVWDTGEAAAAAS
ncbi:MAG: hypothetical protein KatS3mg076_3115 [Candidatus Binatia bacterium]|nr:MAG: hypothetical protein KatS3mg076_3115 [Candidatus Binatia bacterium]